MKFGQHETPADLQNESAVGRAIEQGFNCVLHKLPKSYRLDFMATRMDKPVAWIEVKCRKHASTKYPTLMLSLSKYMEAKRLAANTSVPSYLVVRFTDCIKYCPFDYGTDLRWGGRTKNTRDSRDIEPVLHFPIDRMENLEQ